MDQEAFSLVPMLIGLAGGLALFLHGMTLMSSAMRGMAGSRLNTIMAQLARNRWTALLTGMGITSIVQSSTVTSLIAIGFVSAGVLTLAQALAVIMGAGVGSAVTTQIIAFDISNLSYVLTAIGFGLSLWKSRRIASLAGTAVMGLGLLFIGLGLMSAFMAPLRSHQPFLDLMASMTNPLLGILIGTLFTAIIQSSTATLGVVIALAAQGLIPLQAGIALVFGANIGTTLTALLAAIGQPRVALQAAVGLLGFKVALVAIWLPLIGLLERITRAVSPSAPELALAEQLAFEVPRQVANVHLIVNLSTVLILLPFTNQLARLIERVIGHGPAPREHDEGLAPELTPLLLDVPPMALEAARREVLHLGERVSEQFAAAIDVVLGGKELAPQALHEREERIDRHHGAIVAYLERLLQSETAHDVSHSAIDLVEASEYLEAIADVIDKEIVPLQQRRQQEAAAWTPQSRERLQALAAAVAQELHAALRAVAEADPGLARAVLAAKPQLRSLERAALIGEAFDGAMPVLPNALERELAEALRRAYSLIRRFVRVGTRAPGT